MKDLYKSWFHIIFLFTFLTADDKTPKSCRLTLAQLSLNSMKSVGACIGRPVLLSSRAGQQEVSSSLLFSSLTNMMNHIWNLFSVTMFPFSSARCVWDGLWPHFLLLKLVFRNAPRTTCEWNQAIKWFCTRLQALCFRLRRWFYLTGECHLFLTTTFSSNKCCHLLVKCGIYSINVSNDNRLSTFHLSIQYRF